MSRGKFWLNRLTTAGMGGRPGQLEIGYTKGVNGGGGGRILNYLSLLSKYS